MISGTSINCSSRDTSVKSTDLDIDEAIERLSNQSISANLMHVTFKRSNTAIPEMAPFRFNTKRLDIAPRSREATLLTPLRLKKQVTTVKTTKMMLPRLNRSRTVLDTPFRSCDACCLKYLSKPDIGQKVPMFMFGQETLPENSHGNREEMAMALTSTVKKGPIALSYILEDDSNKYYYSKSQMAVVPEVDQKQDRQDKHCSKDMELLHPGIRKQIERVSQHLQMEDQMKLQREEDRKSQETNLQQFTLTDLSTVLGQAVVNEN